MTILYGVLVGGKGIFERVCLPRLAGGGRRFLAAWGAPSIAEGYNQLLASARAVEGLEALVLLHDDVALEDPSADAKVRAALPPGPTPDVAGVCGAVGVKGLAWWEGSCRGRVRETRATVEYGGFGHPVDAVDGHFLALSRAAVEQLRFDETYGGWDGYDVDFCFLARRNGGVVKTVDVAVFHHVDPAYRVRPSWHEADARFKAKWAAAGMLLGGVDRPRGHAGQTAHAEGALGLPEAYRRVVLPVLVARGARQVVLAAGEAQLLAQALLPPVAGVHGFTARSQISSRSPSGVGISRSRPATSNRAFTP